MNAPANAIAHGQPHGTQTGSVARTVHAKRSEVKGPDLTSPDLTFSVARYQDQRLTQLRAASLIGIGSKP